MLTAALALLAACGGSGADEGASPSAAHASTTPATAVVESAVPTPPATTTPESAPPETTLAPTTTAATTTTSTTTTTTTTTTVAPTTTVPKRDGSRERPFDLRADAEGGPDVLSASGLANYVALNLRDADWDAIYRANRFNEPAPEGQRYVVVTVAATAKDDIEGTMDSYDVACDLVGDLARIYNRAFLSDVDGDLHLLSDQPAVLGGGSIMGDEYYLVAADDGNFRIYCDGIFIIPG